MTASGSEPLPAIGFLTVCRHREHGLFGGLLLLNSSGRPLEFHCTAPVKPNRAQEILYGPTLEPYLFGEQIAYTLISKAKMPPAVVFTDRSPVLAARDLSSMPIVLVATPESSVDGDNSQDGEFSRVDASHRAAPFAPHSLARFQVGRHELAVSRSHDADRDEIERRCQVLSAEFDLCEPFARIREAIQEAQRATR